MFSMFELDRWYLFFMDVFFEKLHGHFHFGLHADLKLQILFQFFPSSSNDSSQD